MSLVLNNSEVRKLRELSRLSEKSGRLTPALLNVIFDRRWLKLFIPKKLNGLQLSFPEALQYEEQLAYVDGSLGWTITLCAGANLFAGYIKKETTEKMFANKKVCLGGSGAVQGVASMAGGGYIVNGYWKYATGAPHLTHFTANCHIEKDGELLLDKNNRPVIKSFYFKRREVLIHEDWHTMGLIATAGHSFSVTNLKVNKDRSFTIDPAHVTLSHPIYKYPFLPFAAATTAVNTLGMTRHFLEEALLITECRKQQQKLTTKQVTTIQRQISIAQNKIQIIADALYYFATSSWTILVKGEQIPANELREIEILSRQLVVQCRKNVAAIYPYCGLATTGADSAINRIFRDMFTASQHGLLLFK